MKIATPVLLLGMIAIACGFREAARSTAAERARAKAADIDAQVVKLFGGAESVATMLAPAKVEAFRVKDRVFKQNEKLQPFGGYPATAGPVAVDLQTAKKIASILLRADTYDFDSAKACEFQPGTALRFTPAKGEPTEIVFCFSCDEIMIVRKGRRVGYEGFDAARGPLLKVFKRLFPGDKAIQSLPSPEEIARRQQTVVEQQIAKVERASRHMPKALRRALLKAPFSFKTPFEETYSTADQRILALLEFEGGNNDWGSYSNWQLAVHELLEQYSADDLKGPLRQALLSDNRALRRGAVRQIEHNRELLSWKPDDRGDFYKIRLVTLMEHRNWEYRQRAVLHLHEWSADVGEAEVEPVLDAGLHDPDASVRRAAMITAAHLRQDRFVPLLMNVLADKPIVPRDLPPVPPEEEEKFLKGYDVYAGARPEPEVAALALAIMNHKPAIELIQVKPSAPMYEVALALLGDSKRLKAEHFNGTHSNRELQSGAVEAVVRTKGRQGLKYAVEYKQATHGGEETFVLDRLKSLLLAQHAPGSDELLDAKKIADLKAWYERHGAKFLQGSDARDQGSREEAGSR